jgi:hypothetical protein
MSKLWICRIAVWLGCMALGVVAAAAGSHDLPLDRTMNGFIKIGKHQADFIVRVPLDLLVGVPFPVAGDHYDIATAGPAVQGALAVLASNLVLWEGSVRLVPSGARGELAPLSDLSFESYDSALAQSERPPAPDTVIAYQLGYLDAHFVYSITSSDSAFAIESTLAADLGDYTRLAIRFMPFDEAGRALTINGASGRVALNPPWYEASAGFVRPGIGRILSGYDHLLFLLCLILPFRRVSDLIPVITAFAVGHSVTLIGTAYGLAPADRWFLPFIEMSIAVSIVYMAIENVVDAGLRRRWIIAGLFGLVHGFGFADLFSERLQFAGSNLLAALLAFNAGIEIGQLGVLCVFVPALALLLRGPMAGRMGIIVVSVVVAHTAWHWMIDRAQVLWATPWPLPTSEGFALLARWIIALVLAGVAASLLARWLDRKKQVAPSHGRWQILMGHLRNYTEIAKPLTGIAETKR